MSSWSSNSNDSLRGRRAAAPRPSVVIFAVALLYHTYGAYGTSLHCDMRRCLLFVLSRHLFYFIYSTPLTLSTDDVWLTRRVANDASDGAANNTTQMKTAQMKSSGQKKTEEEKNKKDTIRLICRILGWFHKSSDRIARVSHCILVCRVGSSAPLFMERPV